MLSCIYTVSSVHFFKQNFSGRKDLPPCQRPPAYPSQHTSNFSIGILPGQQLDTHSRTTYVKHQVRPVSKDNKMLGWCE